MHKALLAVLLVLAFPVSARNIIRYRYGDNPAWASPAFEDREWQGDMDGRISPPPFLSSGYIWVRTVDVSRSSESSLAIQFKGLNSTFAGSAWDLYVNGTLIHQQGHASPPFQFIRGTGPLVILLPVHLVERDIPASIALRIWFPPGSRIPSATNEVHFQIDSARFLKLQHQADLQATLLSIGPELAIEVLITILGIGLLILWRNTGGREIILCAGFILFYAPSGMLHDLQRLGLISIPWNLWSIFFFSFQIMEMAFTIAFIWQIHRLRSRFFSFLCILAVLLYNLCSIVQQLDSHATLLVAAANLSWPVFLHIFNLVTFGANLIAFFLPCRNRFIAAALALIPFASEAYFAGFDHFDLGPLRIDSFELAFLIASIVLFAVLAHRAWIAWRTSDELRVEFDSAREMQQLLVSPAADLPGFHIASAYLPARQVGGDFFDVVEQQDGAVLIVIGDVSGKGLRAAMTVSAIMGALRTLPVNLALSPAAILLHLNRGLAGRMGGGFVTASAASISPDGSMLLANAGQLAPYVNGVELPVKSGLPLGIVPDATYTEEVFDLPPDACLTFLSDGVLEARNPAGELFGFERTAAISNQSAENIARAAQAFGQEDDITVLTLQRLARA
jgi:hypothetical protein